MDKDKDFHKKRNRLEAFKAMEEVMEDFKGLVNKARQAKDHSIITITIE